MGYQIISNIIVVLSAVGLVVVLARKVPQAVVLDEEQVAEQAEQRERLIAKGIPAQAISETKRWLRVLGQKLWSFVLEAKGLKHSASINYRIKKLWPKNGPVVTTEEDTAIVPEAKDEEYYLALIKRHPKQLEYYNDLGQFYLEQGAFTEAVDVYQYLTTHDPVNSQYAAKLGFAALNLESFELAVQSYEHAISLDPSHPSRYYNLGLAHEGMGEWGKGILAIVKALELEPDNEKYQEKLFELESRAAAGVPAPESNNEESEEAQ